MHQSHATTFDHAREIVDPPLSLAPLSGWPLPHLFVLDQYRPGTIARLMGARARRRQAVYAALAAGAMARPQAFAQLLGPSASWHGAIWPALLAEALLTARPEDIVRTAFQSAPAGFVGALGRVGLDPLEEGSYVSLHAIYDDPSQRRRQQVLSSTAKLNDRKLAIIKMVPECCLRPQVLDVCRTLEDAADLQTAVNLALAHSDRSPAEVWSSVAEIGPLTRISVLIERLLRSFTSTVRQPDLGSWEGAIVIDTGSKLRAASRDFRNCLGAAQNLFGVVSGEVAFVSLEAPRVLLQLQSAGEAWCVTGVYGPENKALPGGERRWACNMAEAAGFPVLESVRREDEMEDLANRLRTGWFGFDVGLDPDL